MDVYDLYLIQLQLVQKKLLINLITCIIMDCDIKGIIINQMCGKGKCLYMYTHTYIQSYALICLYCPTITLTILIEVNQELKEGLKPEGLRPLFSID